VATIVAVAVVVALIAAASGGGSAHTVYLTVRDANDVISSQQVRAAGVVVGSVSSVQVIDGGRMARVSLSISDDKLWPLRKGTKLQLRWGGTISAYNRYFELVPSRAGAPLPDGGMIPTADVQIPVEFDQLLSTFVAPVRRSIRSLLDRAGINFPVLKAPLERALAASPPALQQADDVLSDFDANEVTLNQLIRSADSVASAADQATPTLGTLISGAGTTFGVIAGQARDLETSLDELAPTLSHARTTLARADVTLGNASALTARLRPAVPQLESIARPLDSLLGRVVTVGPDLTHTLSVARSAAPSISALLQHTTTLAPTLTTMAGGALKTLQCVRPYTPDIMGFVSDWGGIWSQWDGESTFAQFWVSADPAALPNNSPLTTLQATKLFPGLEYAMPQPPGYDANQSWFQPDCNVTPAALDPADDPESTH
jgi:ABC-type transporter Mla subunit MlaD